MICAVSFVSFAYFFEAGGFNQNSRFALTRAIVEQHTVTIDAYKDTTGDEVALRGHYYSDKAPGVALLAVPFVAAARPVLRVLGVEPTSVRGSVALAYVATIFAVGLPSALGVACLFLIALRLGAAVDGAVFAALSLALATPYWANASMLFGHTLAGACLIFSFAAGLALQNAGTVRRDLLLGLVVGAAGGWATVTEYPAAPASAILALLALIQVWPGGWRRRGRVAATIAAGAGACVLVLMIYQKLAFGSPFDVGYSHYSAGLYPELQTGFLGLTYPHPVIVAKIFLSPYCGLFLLAPVIVATPYGLWLLGKQKRNRNAVLAATLIAAYYICFNASFIDWRGGFSYGPRYMLAGLPMLFIGLGAVWGVTRPSWRWLLAGLTALGTMLSLMAVATYPLMRGLGVRCPIFQLILPSFLAGKLAIGPKSVVLPIYIKTHEAFNLGELAGLHGLASLIPLLAFWCLGALAWMRFVQPEKLDIVRPGLHTMPDAMARVRRRAWE
jgi:hypothetical protein